MDQFMEQPADTPDSDAAANSPAEDSNTSAADDQLGLHQSDPDSPEQTEEDEEVEIGDRKVALPKSVAERLKSERMMHADYTQKTQSVADERKQVASEREQVQKQREQAQSYLNEMADYRAVEKQLQELDKINLADYVDTDPTGVLRVQEQRRMLESKRATLAGSITQKQHEQALSEQQTFAKRVQDAEAYIEREINGVNKERIAALEKYAISQGMDVKAYANAIISTPQVAVMAHKAELYDALMKKQAPKPPTPPAAQPATRVSGSSAAVKRDPTKMSDAEFAAYRRSVSKRK